MPIRKRRYCQRADCPPTKVNNWTAWITATVNKFIKTKALFHLKRQKANGRRENEFREDLIQECWLRLAYAQQKDDAGNYRFKGAQSDPYLKRVIMNHLTNWNHKMEYQGLRGFEVDEKGNKRAVGWTTDSIDEDGFAEPVQPGSSTPLEAGLDVARLSHLAKLTDSHMVVLELIYGFGRGADPVTGEPKQLTIKEAAQLLQKTTEWVRWRHTSALIKMRVIAQRRS
jgi:hypothetical protein